jgi:hypothetical protein
MLETAMDINVIVRGPATVTETLNRVELVPFGGLGVVYLQGNYLSNLICAASDNHHQRTKEQSRVLITRNRSFSLTLIRSLNPVPTPVSMSPESPGIIQ